MALAAFHISHGQARTGQCQLRIEGSNKPSIVIITGNSSHAMIESSRKPSIVIFKRNRTDSGNTDSGSRILDTGSLLRDSGARAVELKSPEVSIFVVRGGKACEAFRRPKLNCVQDCGLGKASSASSKNFRQRVHFDLRNSKIAQLDSLKSSAQVKQSTKAYYQTFRKSQRRPVRLCTTQTKSASVPIESITSCGKTRTLTNESVRRRKDLSAICRFPSEMKSHSADSNPRTIKLDFQTLPYPKPVDGGPLSKTQLHSKAKVSAWMESNFNMLHGSSTTDQYGESKKRRVFAFKTKSIIRIITDLLKVLFT